MMKPTPTTCIDISAGIPNSEQARGINSNDPPATPDAPKAPALPETGVTDASTVTLLGAALGLVGLAGLAKRKRDENE